MTLTHGLASSPTTSEAETVWKFPLVMSDSISVDLPEGAVILYLAVQFGRDLCLWARVNPKAPKERRWFKMRGTGHVVGADCGKHVGSFMLRDGELVFHVFEAASQ